MIGHLLFAAKASLLRLKRLAVDRPPPRKGAVLENGSFDQLVSEVRAPLRDANDANSRLTVGKIENLRRAVRAVHGIELEAGEPFSFWSQVGRPTRWRGFVEGREIREGCVVPSIGGGLCQLSNALYGAALDANFPILERHAHSRAITRSAVVGRDATVFWNYIDFRFQTTFALRISATLTAEDLVVQFWTRRQSDARLPVVHRPTLQRVDFDLDVRDCTTCNRSDCRRSKPYDPVPTSASHRVVPPRTTARVDRVLRSLAVRWCRFRDPLSSLAPVHLRQDTRLARQLARQIPQLKNEGGELREVTHLTVPLRLLVPLAETGALGGRSYDVVLDRLPLPQLHAALDAAAARWPESETLGDFRAAPAYVRREAQLLADARAVVPGPANAPMPLLCKKGGNIVYFPASPLGRFGAFALRDALKGLPGNVEVVTRGSATDGRPLGWRALPLEGLEEVAVVVFPAVVIGPNSPAMTLFRAALYAGIPGIASETCPFAPEERAHVGELLTIVPWGDDAALTAAIATQLPR
jgi:hypothetical protein